MHKKYAGKDFVAISVSLDDPGDPRQRQKVLDFLTKQQATFTNVILNAKPEDWQQKLKIEGPPCLYVFDRDNRFVKKLPRFDDKGEAVEPAEYDIVEKAVAELMGK